MNSSFNYENYIYRNCKRWSQQLFSHCADVPGQAATHSGHPGDWWSLGSHSQLEEKITIQLNVLHVIIAHQHLNPSVFPNILNKALSIFTLSKIALKNLWKKITLL